MERTVTTRTALLQALRDGPGHGKELIERVSRITGARVRLSDARVYPALKALEREGFVVGTTVCPRGRRGARSRTCYDLTVRGVEASEAERAVLASLISRQLPREPSRAHRSRMALRLLEAEDLAAFGAELRAARRAAGDASARRG